LNRRHPHEGLKLERIYPMVNWELAGKDPYYNARSIEEKAREENSAETWREFAELKENKGSYTLAVHGYMNSALVCEQQGRVEEAFDLLGKAFHNARLAGSKELALIVAYHHALLAERAERWDVCLEVYEAIGKFCEEKGSYFLAADACEHVAEILAKTGKDVAAYTRPAELWEKNARYWRERGQEEDAQWSERHIKFYKSLFEEHPA
jgi:tetratricopeptide (TPR) repeat protein